MKFFSKKRIYMDYASTTPVLAEVRKVMEKYWSKDFYNPSSIYDAGVGMKAELESYRARVAKILGVSNRDIIFTSGGTESDNLAILGAFEAYKELHPHKRGHIVVSAIEHPAVMEAAAEVKRRGGDVSIVGVDEFGRVKPHDVAALVRGDTFLVSIMLASNEVGTIEPVSKIGRHLEEQKKKEDSAWPYFHTDASQAANYLSCELSKLHTDMLTLDASKIYGPKGVGVLAVRPQVKLRPQVIGGAQERGMRAGTESMALIAGFAHALEAASRDRDSEEKRLRELQEYFIESVRRDIPDAFINTPKESLPNIISVSLPGRLSEMILLALDRKGVEVSVGSACASANQEPGSYVVRALGKPELAESTIRFSFGRFTTKREVNKVTKLFLESAKYAKISL